MLRRWTLRKRRGQSEVSLMEYDTPQHFARRAKGRIVELTNLYVPIAYRKEGYGRLLVGTALKYAQRFGWSVVLRVHPHGDKKMTKRKLTEFYKSFGFKPAESDHDYWYILNTIDANIDECY